MNNQDEPVNTINVTKNHHHVRIQLHSHVRRKTIVIGDAKNSIKICAHVAGWRDGVVFIDNRDDVHVQQLVDRLAEVVDGGTVLKIILGHQNLGARDAVLSKHGLVHGDQATLAGGRACARVGVSAGATLERLADGAGEHVLLKEKLLAEGNGAARDDHDLAATLLKLSRL